MEVEQASDFEQAEPLGVDHILELARAAGEGITDSKAAKAARVARAMDPDVIETLARLGDGSPESQRAFRELKALGVAASALKEAVRWFRQQQVETGEGWRENLKYKNSEIISAPANATTILLHDPRWAGVLAWDDFREGIVFRLPPPWHDDDRPADDGCILDDFTTPAIGAWLLREYGLRLDDRSVYGAAVIVARGRGRRFNSLCGWLLSLVWDGVPRIGAPAVDTDPGSRSWLTTYLGVAESPYARFVGRSALVAAVARAFEPGCQADHVLILEGAQGVGKSTVLRALVGNDYFSDSQLPLHDKDRYCNLRGVWVQSFDELAGFGKADQNMVKNFITSRFDIYRPPYGRHAVTVKRKCVFVATINPTSGAGYLKDETGARRFWPVQCNAAEIDPGRVSADREQLWAEAVAMYHARVKWWPTTPDERALCEQEQADRQEADPWEQPILRWLDGHLVALPNASDVAAAASTAARPHKPRQHATPDEIARGALAIPVDKLEQRLITRIARIMGRFGWSHKRRMIDGIRAWRYYRPGSPGDVAPDEPARPLCGAQFYQERRA